MIKEGEFVTLKPRIPVRWDAALDKFSRSKVLPDYLGKDYCKFFLGNRRTEATAFHNAVSPLDYEWYLRSV